MKPHESVESILKNGNVPSQLIKIFSKDCMRLAQNVHSNGISSTNQYDRNFAGNIISAKRCSDKQSLVLAKMYVKQSRNYKASYNDSLDHDIMRDCGYESHPGQFDGYQ